MMTAITLSRNTLPAFAIVGIFWGGFAAYVPEIKAGFALGDAAFSWALLASAAGAVVAMFLAPYAARAMGRWAMLAAGLAMAAAFQLPIGATSQAGFYAGMLAAGSMTGLLDVMMNARLSRIEAREGASLMNLNHAGFSFAYAASAIVAGLLREAEVDAAQMFAGVGVVAALLALAALEPRPPREAMADAEAISVPYGLWRLVVLAGLIVLIAFLSENATEAWSALHIERTLGGGAAEGALGPAMLGLTMGLGRMMGQVVVGRLSEAGVLRVSAFVTAAGAAIAAVAPSPVVAYLGFGILGLGVSVMAPMALALAGRLSNDAARAAVISRVTGIGYCGFFIGPPALGLLSELFGLRVAFGVVALLLLAVPLVLRGLLRGR